MSIDNKNSRHTILVIDQEQSLDNILGQMVDDDVFTFQQESDFELGRQQIKLIQPSVVILRLDPPVMAGLDIINWITRQQLKVSVIAISDYGSSEVAASAIRAGASDFVQLPMDPLRLKNSLNHAIERLNSEENVNDLALPASDGANDSFMGSSPSMLEVYELAIRAAKSDASVFITGENGTGKEVCAQLIHRASKRCDQRMIDVNAAAIPSTLAESEVFGHVKGAFTGAVDAREGMVKQANNSTLFLDEIGEMPLELQAKLLRFVQTGKFQKVGSNQLESVDVRFICATNRDPSLEIEEGRFREDLFYRLNVIQIHLPALRDRGDDVLVMAHSFLEKFSQEENKSFKYITPETESILKSYSWPGNVRELQNVVRNIVILHDGETVIPSMLPISVIQERGDRRKGNNNRRDSPRSQYEIPATATTPEALDVVSTVSAIENILMLDEVVRTTISDAIEVCEGNVVKAAYHLGVSPSTLYRKLKRTSEEKIEEESRVMEEAIS